MIHVLHIMANNSSVPYFNWLAGENRRHSGFRFSFVAMNNTRPAMLDEMKAAGCDCYWIPFDQGKRKRSMLKAVPSLIRLFKQVKPDIVHSHLFDDSVPSLFAARMAGIRTRFITKQDTTFHWYYAPGGVKYDRLNNRNATHIVAVSEECRQFVLEKEKAEPGKVSLVHHGIPFEKLAEQDEQVKQELRSRYHLEGKTVIGTVARLIEWKGYRHIIEAAPAVVKQYPNVRFLFAGQGPQEAELRKMVSDRKLNDHVVFAGWVERSAIPSLYGIMDIYLHAASHEPFGFVIAEAMANGTPVVSTPTGAAKDGIVHRKNGYLVEGAIPEGIVQGIEFMMGADRKQLGEAGRKTAQELFSIERMWKGYAALYTRAMGR